MSHGIWCGELELADPSKPHVRSVVERTSDHERARVLIRMHGQPLGYLNAEFAEVEDASQLAARAFTEFADLVDAHMAAEGSTDATAPALPSCPTAQYEDRTVTVVVCTRDRPAEIAKCLRALIGIRYPRTELLIVDNAPSSDATKAVVAGYAARDERIRYVVEPRPGVSSARNRGLQEATGEVIAYTDDDVEVDAGWVEGVLLGFARRDDVACVTGLVCTASIRGSAEAYFDARTPSWSSRCQSDLFDLSTRRNRLYPYSAGLFGTGANFAFDRAALQRLGGFDESLGAGTPTRGGEDLDVFVRVLRSGGAIAYEPSAIVWHHHRGDDAALLRQLFGYGTGLGAFMTKLICARETRYEVLRRMPRGVARGAHIPAETAHRLQAPLTPPRGATWRELSGFFAGPFLYARSRRSRSRRRR